MIHHTGIFIVSNQISELELACDTLCKVYKNALKRETMMTHEKNKK
jgi:hypothetical protein